MKNNIVSLRYARGLIKASKARNEEEDVKLQIARLLKLLSDYPNLKDLLLSHTVNPFAKQDIIESLSKDLDLTEITKNFIFLLIRKGRIDQIEDIFSIYQDELDYQAGIRTAEVTVAKVLTESQKEQLKKKLSRMTGYKIKLKIDISQEIIGGVIVKIGSVIYDGSLKQQLQKLKKRIYEV
jgi:F-type H+-transporting ATPase subunit delta